MVIFGTYDSLKDFCPHSCQSFHSVTRVFKQCNDIMGTDNSGYPFCVNKISNENVKKRSQNVVLLNLVWVVSYVILIWY